MNEIIEKEITNIEEIIYEINGKEILKVLNIVLFYCFKIIIYLRLEIFYALFYKCYTKIMIKYSIIELAV